MLCTLYTVHNGFEFECFLLLTQCKEMLREKSCDARKGKPYRLRGRGGGGGGVGSHGGWELSNSG